MTPDELLLVAILRNCPPLAGAACKGRAEVFDADTGDVATAIEICAGCAVLDQCRQWVDGLPKRRRPPGVTAGRVHR